MTDLRPKAQEPDVRRTDRRHPRTVISRAGTMGGRCDASDQRGHA
jgi:hypothetical protein